jgi:hypothetical protein
MRILVIFLCLLVFTPNHHAQETVISVLRFNSSGAGEQGSGDVGNNVATNLGIQIWLTLFQTPIPKNFDNSGIYWATKITPPKTFTEAEELARNLMREGDLDSPLILWGRAFQYGDGIVVKSYVSVLKYGTGEKIGINIWEATISKGQRQFTLAVDIPAWQYEFAPIVLRSDLPLEINDPTNYPLYEDSKGRKKIGPLGFEFEVKARIRDYIRVSLPGGKKGYIYAPNLSRKPNEVISFCGGVIRIFREDWAGALKFFNEVVNNNNAPTAIRINAYLYMAIARGKMGDQAKSLSLIEEAYKLNPYLKTTVQYLCLSHFVRLADVSSKDMQGAKAQQIIQAIQDVISKNRVLFAVDDPWILKAEQTLASIRR